MNRLRPWWPLPIALACALFASASARAQGQAAPAPSALCLDARVEGAGLDAEQLRLQLERELGLAVVRAPGDVPPCLVVEAQSLGAAYVAFARADGTRIERTLDVSTSGAHALETIALLAANLVRDEAGELLAELQRRTGAEVSPTPTPTPTPTPAPTPPRPSGCDPTGLRRVAIGADFVPHLGSSLVQGTDVERRVSLNVLGSVTEAVRGFELSGLFSIDRRSLCGVQVSGLFNLVLGPVDGAQISLINVARGAAEGAQIGLVSIAAGPIEGVQVGLVNVGTGLGGAQLGLVNVDTGPRDGVQVGLANLTGAAANGAQIGIANLTTGTVEGAQVGVVNVAGPLDGAQLGLANVSSGRVDGAMVGLLNVAEYADVPIAPISILSRGRTHLDVWATDAGMLMVGIEHGSARVHNVFGIGATVRESRGVFAFSYGIGVRVFQDERFFVDIDAMGYGLLTRNPELDRIELTTIEQLRIPVSLRLSEDVALFLAPSVNLGLAQSDDLITDPSLYGSTRLSSRGADLVVRIWPGFNVGGRFF